VDVLSVFRDNSINLSYIESRPSRKVFGDYTFFIDFEGHIEDENVQKTLGRITPFVNFYRLLGSYPKGGVISPVGEKHTQSR
jgi:prephenate dehydratase